MDLTTPIVPEARWHPNFANMVKRPNAWNIAVLNDWATGFKDRDGKFVKEFQTTFNACFWELYVNAVLREYKLSVDWRFASPDFTVTAPGPFTIEAAIASNADGSPPENRRADARLPEEIRGCKSPVNGKLVFSKH